MGRVTERLIAHPSTLATKYSTAKTKPVIDIRLLRLAALVASSAFMPRRLYSLTFSMASNSATRFALDSVTEIVCAASASPARSAA
ncbi:hypothetical protein G6F46_014786 [Rhizopus delemar]|nr:hypothetical protein G6F46_014786 [Rhizopus delemar]